MTYIVTGSTGLIGAALVIGAMIVSELQPRKAH